MMPDQQRTILSRIEHTSQAVERDLTPGHLSEYPIFVGSVYGNPNVPAVTNVFISVHPVDIGGNEVEGGPGTITIDGSRTIVAFLVGSMRVGQGDYVICRYLANRWVAERLGRNPSSITIAGCPCANLPASITMTSSKPDSNNHMFQNATLVYGPPPTPLAPLKLGTKAYISTQQYLDYNTNDHFWYYLGCFQGFYTITRVYATSVYSSPYRDQIRYRWNAGTTGNTCSPFLLSKGAIYAGGDASCVVTLSG